jgi:putative transposase
MLGQHIQKAYKGVDFTIKYPWVLVILSRFRDEFLNTELLTSVQEDKLLTEQHRIEYTTMHSALQGRKPLEVIQHWKAA